MTEEQRAEIKKALIKCAEENEGKNTFTGYVIVSSVCKAGAERIAELEKENEQLTISYETLKLHDEEEIEMLKSENAELRQQYKSLLNSRNEELAEHNEHWNVICEHIESNLTKAKEIIRDFISVAIDYIDPIDKNYSLIAEAEQFLKGFSTGGISYEFTE